MKKETSKGPFEVKDGIVELKHRVRPYPQADSFLVRLAGRGDITKILHHLKNDLSTFESEEKNLPLLNSKVGKELISELSRALQHAENSYAEKNLEMLAQNMYSIGLKVGKLNHVEGWHKELVSVMNRTKGPAVAGKKAKEAAEARNALIRENVVRYFKFHPQWENKDAVENLKEKEPNLVEGLRDKAIVTIIAGCKKQALNEPWK